MSPVTDSGPIAVTAQGQVLGVRLDGGVQRFLGIPYAEPPVGERRFAAPERHASWDGVRDATAPGPTAPQRLRSFPGLDLEPLVGSGWLRGDDFLTVNVWTPDVDAQDLPVLVFIHGGAFVVGHSGAPGHDGTAFARSGVVCVTINYRLGVEGFVAVPGAPTNLGLRDQLCALQWVKRNIAAFGGDPDNVTVSGESAGAMSLAVLLASPAAKGLFRRAIIQSGHGSMVRPVAVAQRLTRAVAKLMGVEPTLEGFRSRSMDDALTAIEAVQQPTAKIDLRDARGRDPSYGLSRFLPVWGDDLIPEPPLDALAAGAGADVDLLIGTNAEEMNLYFVPTGVKRKLNALLAWLFLRRVEPRAGAVLRAYRRAAQGSSWADAFVRATSDLVFRLPARRFAAAHRGRTHVYEFGWRSPASGGELGACHGLEIPFVFDTLSACAGPMSIAGEDPPQALADCVHRVWVDFIRDGTAPWPEYSGDSRQVLALERGEAVTERPFPADPLWP